MEVEKIVEKPVIQIVYVDKIKTIEVPVYKETIREVEKLVEKEIIIK